MKKKFYALLLGACIMTESCMLGFEVPKEEREYNGKSYLLTFYDDFSSNKLDTRKWAKCPEWERQTHLQNHGWWSNECSYVKDGNLVIEGKKKNGKLLSGGVRTKGKFEQAFGLYEIKFKIEKTSGLWNAFWLMTEKEQIVGNGAVDGGEIDIFEVLPNDTNQPAGKRTYINSALHWDGYGKDHKSKGSSIVIDDSFFDEWHTILFEWTEDSYKAFLDGEEYWSVTGDEAEAWGGIVTSKNYIKITSEFGRWAGPLDESALPSKMYVDYIKVYKQMK